MKNVVLLPVYGLLFFLASCKNERSNKDSTDDKTQLLTLERKWLEAEFALDTAYLSSQMDSTFTGISEQGMENKKEALLGMYNNISMRLKDSIFIDSFTFENARVNLYQKTAVVSFVVHSYGRNKQALTERRTRFYDVWIKREGRWKVVASQGTRLAN